MQRIYSDKNVTYEQLIPTLERDCYKQIILFFATSLASAHVAKTKKRPKPLLRNKKTLRGGEEINAGHDQAPTGDYGAVCRHFRFFRASFGAVFG
jgi:hypothetical protein